MFRYNPENRPSLKILNALYEHDDFMESIRTVADIGCGTGEDLVWWATRTTRDDENPQPLNIRCTGIDQLEQLPLSQRYTNVTYQRTDFEDIIHAPQNLFDVLWCHDAFQYCVNPLTTLRKWRDIASDGAMLIIAVPQTVQVQHRHINYYLPSGAFYHHSLVSLIYMLAATGWDCKNGFFQQAPLDPWIRAVVYKTSQQPKEFKNLSWYDLADSGLLPESAEKSIGAHGHLRYQDLILPWLDHNLTWMGKQ